MVRCILLLAIAALAAAHEAKVTADFKPQGCGAAPKFKKGPRSLSCPNGYLTQFPDSCDDLGMHYTGTIDSDLAYSTSVHKFSSFVALNLAWLASQSPP